VLHYYGLGNDTPNLGNSDFYRVDQQQYLLEPSFVLPIGSNVQVSIGLLARYTHTGDNTGRFIAPLQDTLLGAQNFGQVGGRIGFDLDARDRPLNAHRGVHLSATAEVDPAVWDVPTTFGSGAADAVAFVAAPMTATPTLFLRAGARKVWGSFPFFESAFLGGASTLPGYHSHRFAGDARVYGGAQLRLTAGPTFLALPALWGVFGNVDAGRVYVDGESPGGWHSSAGGGLWLGYLDGRDVLSLSVAASDEGTLLRARIALGF
jgi:outer membrane protein assembly factor BamA